MANRKLASARRQLTHKRLKELLHYNPRTGVFTWLVDRGNRVKAGDRAGRVNRIHHRSVRCLISIDGVEYKACRLAVYYMTGQWPLNEVDHIDGNPLNDQWRNLRLATQSQNTMNRHANRDNKLGEKNIIFYEGRTKPYSVQVRWNRKHVFSKSFPTLEEAITARNAALRKYHGEFARW